MDNIECWMKDKKKLQCGYFHLLQLKCLYTILMVPCKDNLQHVVETPKINISISFN